MPNGTSANGRKAVTPSSGNVFADVGLPDAGVALAKADLAHRIADIIRQRKYTQSQAAEVLGLTQPKVSELVRGNLLGFTLDRLMKLLNRLGQDVEIAVRPTSRKNSPASTRVVSVS